MPIREYTCAEEGGGCGYCRGTFEEFEQGSQPVLAACPRCGAPLRRLFSAPNFSTPGKLDDRARSAGFHKLKKTGRGEYEKLY